jgi:flagellar biosynthesis/type III secretory pathway M-ring protein FliF/YscJ
VEQVSVAVMVGAKLDNAKLLSIRNVVEAAAGIDAKRGDKVIVENMQFDDSAAKDEEKELKSAASKETYVSVGKTVLGVLLLLGFLFFLKSMLSQIKISVPEKSLAGVPAGQARTIDELVGGPAGAPGHSTMGLDSPDVGQANPEEVAQVVREWIAR